MSDDLCFMPATEMLTRFRDRSLSPVEVTTAMLAQIETVDPQINAYVTVTGDLAMEQAKKRSNPGRPESPVICSECRFRSRI